MIFGNRTIGLHVLRGLLGLGALCLALTNVQMHSWTSLFLLFASLFFLKGCPMCWIVGLIETIEFSSSKSAKVPPHPEFISYCARRSFASCACERRDMLLEVPEVHEPARVVRNLSPIPATVHHAELERGRSARKRGDGLDWTVQARFGVSAVKDGVSLRDNFRAAGHPPRDCGL